MSADAAPAVRVAAIGDLHARAGSQGAFRALFATISAQADILLLCGDLTDTGVVGEARVLAEELQACTVPVVAVLGNHDYENNQQEQVLRTLSAAKVNFLEAGPLELRGIGFAGVKGFCGGFDHHMLQPWGEGTIKQFVSEAVTESMHLESSLAKLRTEKTVAVLHYAPVRGTVEGEPLEIYPYLGSSRMAEPIDHFDVTLVVHGHAHMGSPVGKTSKGIPVYNVALPLLRRTQPERPYLILPL